MELLNWLLISYWGIGAIVGLLAGLLGIGGGLVIVPALTLLLPYADIDQALVMPMALATSLASIIITSSASAWSHYQMGHIQLKSIAFLLPGLLLGGFIGSMIADVVPANILPKVFGGIVLCLAMQMAISLKVTAHHAFPSAGFHFLSGSGIGTISSLAGIGGGSLTVPYLNYFGIQMKQAIGSASFCGVFLAFSGMTGFVFFGLRQSESLPSYSLGYVYFPALIGIVSASVFTTRIGAKLASHLPTLILKRFFAVFLLVIGLGMFFH